MAQDRLQPTSLVRSNRYRGNGGSSHSNGDVMAAHYGRDVIGRKSVQLLIVNFLKFNYKR